MKINERLNQPRFSMVNNQIILNSRTEKKEKKALCYSEEAMLHGNYKEQKCRWRVLPPVAVV